MKQAKETWPPTLTGKFHFRRKPPTVNMGDVITFTCDMITDDFIVRKGTKDMVANILDSKTVSIASVEGPTVHAQPHQFKIDKHQSRLRKRSRSPNKIVPVAPPASEQETRWWNRQVGNDNFVGAVMKVMTSEHAIVNKGEYGLCLRLDASDRIEIRIFD